MTRRQLPSRRDADVFDFEHAGIAYRAHVGRFDDGSPAELFLDGGKIGSAAAIGAHDGAVLASLALQSGLTVDRLLHSMQQLRDGSPAGPVAKALSLAAAGAR
jgi:hypothetical protein